MGTPPSLGMAELPTLPAHRLAIASMKRASMRRGPEHDQEHDQQPDGRPPVRAGGRGALAGIDAASLSATTLFGLEKRPDLRQIEGALWRSAILTAVLAGSTALRRGVVGPWQQGLAGTVMVLLEIALGAAVLTSGARWYFSRGWQAILRARLDRYSLLAIGLGAAFIHGVISTWAPPALLARPGDTVVEVLPSLALSGAMVTLLLLGDWLERCEGISLLAPPISSAVPGRAVGSARMPFVAPLNTLARALTWWAIAAATAGFVGWALLGPEPRAGHSLMNALAALIAACPTAVGLIAPLTVRAAMDHATGARIQFHSFDDLELLRRVDILVLDERGELDEVEASLDAEAVRKLHQEGVRVILLTQGSRMEAEAIARRLSIDDVRAEIGSDQRAAEIRGLRAGGCIVAVVTDGRDDPQIAREAHLVIALGGRLMGVSNPGVRLLDGSLAGLCRARRISRATVTNIKENISFAFVSSALAVPLAAGILYPITGAQWGPLAAAVSVAASAAAVILNSLRLRYLKV
jgi:cation transport ATPase